jgi:hypothetical protein
MSPEYQHLGKQRSLGYGQDGGPLHDVNRASDVGIVGERTPLIKIGVKPDIRRTAEDVERSRTAVKQVEVGLGKMVELGLPLIMYDEYISGYGLELMNSSHEISRSIFRFRRMGCLEAVGPAVSLQLLHLPRNSSIGDERDASTGHLYDRPAWIDGTDVSSSLIVDSS